jgi:hypothetical protein
MPINPRNNSTNIALVITPTAMESKVVSAAWSYALRYTAKGLDLPDYQSALKMLKQRHPSWTIIESQIDNAIVNLAIADTDKPE